MDSQLPISIGEFAKRLGVTTRAVNYWIQKRQFGASQGLIQRPCGTVAINWQQFQAWNSQGVRPRPTQGRVRGADGKLKSGRRNRGH